jgi:hypothetical protein
VWFYASRGQSVEKKYPDLCQLLNVRAYPHLSKARAVLEPSLEELTEIGYLSSWEMTRTSRGSDFKLMLSPGKRLLSLPNFSTVVNPEARAALEARLPSWIGELVERGVAERKARQLALDIPDEQAVSDQIEYAEYLIQQDRRGRMKISNPAGFFIWAIENNLSVPAEFETSRKRRLREAEQQADSEHRSKTMQLENDYDDFCHEQIRKELESQYPADRLESALRDQMKAIKREQPEWFARIPEATKREVALGRLKSTIRGTLNLPSFENWTKQNPQQRLFSGSLPECVSSTNLHPRVRK